MSGGKGVIDRAAERVRRALAAGEEILLILRCAGCGAERERRVRPGLRVVEERAEGAFRTLLLEREGRPAVRLKIFSGRQPVESLLLEHDPERAPAGVSVLYLHARELLEDPRRWRPHRVEGMRPLFCASCREAFRAFRRQAEEVSRRTGVPLPGFPYRYGIARCWKCGEEILAFAWTDEGWPKAEPPSPRPRTVQWRFSRTIGSSYWANTCPFCGAIQGDWFLHHEPEGPFFGAFPMRVPWEKDDPWRWLEDMVRIARWRIEGGAGRRSPPEADVSP